MGRPPQGLADADVVYEMRVEGGITRFMGIFFNEAPRIIGPIRSVRQYYLPIVTEYGAMIVHAGADPGGFNDIVVYRVPEHDGVKTSAGFFRSSDRSAPYNLFLNLEKALPAIKRAPNTQSLNAGGRGVSWSYGETTNIQSSPAKTIRIKYGIGGVGNTAEWRYDEKIQQYVRYVGGTPLRDRKTGAPLTTKNIIIQVAPQKARPKDTKGRIMISVIGHGTGWAASGGVADKIYWSKSSYSARTYFAKEDHSELHLAEGNTWVQVVPPEAETTIE
ncbi:MAG: DUF3048 domain-containing protein [bacterium JZ-2024 1]